MVSVDLEVEYNGQLWPDVKAWKVSRDNSRLFSTSFQTNKDETRDFEPPLDEDIPF